MTLLSLESIFFCLVISSSLYKTYYFDVTPLFEFLATWGKQIIFSIKPEPHIRLFSENNEEHWARIGEQVMLQISVFVHSQYFSLCA